jgi:hypothetical protein
MEPDHWYTCTKLRDVTSHVIINWASPLQVYILEALGFNFSRDTGYRDTYFMVFLSLSW